MNIAIDVDDVISLTADAIVEKANQKYNLDVKRKDLKSFNWWECTPITEEMFWNCIKEMDEEKALLNLEIEKGADKVINKLYKNKKNSIYFITARGVFWDNHREDTIEWFDKKKIKYDAQKMIFSQEKQDFVERFNLEYFIEDNPKRALLIAEKKINVLLMNRPWNQHISESRYIKRIYTWKEIDEIFRKDNIY